MRLVAICVDGVVDVDEGALADGGTACMSVGVAVLLAIRGKIAIDRGGGGGHFAGDLLKGVAVAAASKSTHAAKFFLVDEPAVAVWALTAGWSRRPVALRTRLSGAARGLNDGGGMRPSQYARTRLMLLGEDARLRRVLLAVMVTDGQQLLEGRTQRTEVGHKGAVALTAFLALFAFLHFLLFAVSPLLLLLSSSPRRRRRLLAADDCS